MDHISISSVCVFSFKIYYPLQCIKINKPEFEKCERGCWTSKINWQKKFLSSWFMRHIFNLRLLDVHTRSSSFKTNIAGLWGFHILITISENMSYGTLQMLIWAALLEKKNSYPPHVLYHSVPWNKFYFDVVLKLEFMTVFTIKNVMRYLTLNLLLFLRGTWM